MLVLTLDNPINVRSVLKKNYKPVLLSYPSQTLRTILLLSHPKDGNTQYPSKGLKED